MHLGRKWGALVPLVLLGFLLFVAIGGGLVQLLWNWLLPPLFGWREVTFWQALGLLALCRILFGGRGLHGSGKSSFRRRMAERWEQMTPEQRARFQHGMHGGCDSSPSSGETKEP